jgi:predicted DsbA family dithiol-disulfide isomerase
MKIEVWSDYNCPFCYIGKVHLDKALAELKLTDKVEIVYRAYQLDPSAPKLARQSTAEGLAHKYGVSLDEAKGMMQNVVNKAKAIGLTYNYDLVKPTNTYDAHRLMKIADKTEAKALNTALYDAYFTLGKNLADYEVLMQFAQTFNINKDSVKAMLYSDKLREEVNADIAEAKAIGIRGVPYFRINKKSVIPGAQPIETFVDVLRHAYVTEMGKT